jgi:hypothetical protein
MKKHPVGESESDLPLELASPARRALAAAGVERLDQLTGFSEAEVKAWHGIGLNALSHLRRALSARDLSFADDHQKEKK